MLLVAAQPPDATAQTSVRTNVADMPTYTRLAASGLENFLIAQVLGTEIRTVSTHLSNIYDS